MANEPYIEFKERRELGDILSDTFAFLRNEFKPFMRLLLRIVGPYLLLMVIAQAIYLYFVGDQASGMFQKLDFDGISELYIVGTILFYVFAVMAVFALSQLTVLYYIKGYAARKGPLDHATVRNETYAALPSFLGLLFLVGLSLFAGAIVCCFPAVYLWVPLSLSFAVLVFEGKGALDAYGGSFALVRGEWWITFATLIVVTVVITVASYAFAVPAMIYGYLKTALFSGELDAESNLHMFKDPVYILLNVVSSLAQFLLGIVSVVASALIYFNLNEKKHFTGTHERIRDLGQNPRS